MLLEHQPPSVLQLEERLLLLLEQHSRLLKVSLREFQVQLQEMELRSLSWHPSPNSLDLCFVTHIQPEISLISRYLQAG
jgi:hypothetical protein